MPGFMGLRGMEPLNPYDLEKGRREEKRVHSQSGLEKRAQEKVQEILRGQEGDMSAYTGSVPGPRGECEIISAYRVSQIMSGRVAVLSFDDTLLTAQGIFSNVKFRHLPVVEEDGDIIGIISDRDVLRLTSPFYGTINEQTRDKEIMARKVGMMMTRNPICIDIDASVLDAVKLMNSKKISALPVVANRSRKLQGIVAWKDIVRAFCPAGFNKDTDSNRLRAGAHINPQSSESARLRAKEMESVRRPAASMPQPAPAPAAEAVGQRTDTDYVPVPTQEKQSINARLKAIEDEIHKDREKKPSSRRM